MYQPFSIIFYKRNGLFNWLVRKVTGKKYGHCSLKLDNTHIFETNLFTKSNIRHIRVSSNNYDVYEYVHELTDKQKREIIEFIHKEMNIPYDIISVFSSFKRILFGGKVRFSEKSRRCEEIIFEAYLSIGVKLVDDKNDLTPSKLSESKLLRKINK